MTSIRPVDGLLDRAPCGFVAFGDDGCVRVVNATLLDRLGYTRDEVEGGHVEKLFTVAGRLFYQTHLFPLVKMHGGAQELFLLLRAKSGETVGVLCNAVRRGNGATALTECVLFEVRERAKYEEALLEARRVAERANEQLEAQALELELQQQQLQEQAVELERERAAADAANHAKSEFLAVMSHELRTPLNAIGGYTELLETGVYGPVPEAQRKALERVTRSQRHLLGLINDVLNLARIDAGRVEYSLAAVAIASVVAELGAMIEPQMASKHLVYDVVLPPEPLAVRSDRDKVVQILLNLVSNAIKFTAEGGSITTRVEVAGERANLVRIDVADTGRGIPPEKVEAVFEPFVQVRPAGSTKNEGTGLGLAISRNLARGMGGDLTAVSVLGEGSTFTLTLPRADAQVHPLE